MRKRKKYTSEFKQEAIRLMESSEEPSSEVARHLGVRRNQLYSDDPPKCGTTGVGSSGYIIPKMVNEVLGAKINVISGYQGGKEVDLAVEKGEVHCRGITISSHFGREPFDTWHQKGFDLHLLQTSEQPGSETH